MRWTVTLCASRDDVERLAAESLDGLSAPEDAPERLILELHDPEGDAVGEDAPHAAKAVIDATLRRINGFGKLRWGRRFEGVTIDAITSFDADGRPTQRLFLDAAAGHLEPEEIADLAERLGQPHPPPPLGLDTIRALDGEVVTGLAAEFPVVAHVLHLVDLMLRDDRDLDWVAAYSAFEAINHDLRRRGLDGIEQGWWTRGERSDFTGTANSVEALGARARHGKPGGVAEMRMSEKDASWFVRRVAAHWLTHLVEA